MTLTEIKTLDINRVVHELLPFGINVIKFWGKHNCYDDVFGEMQISLMQGIVNIRKGAIDHHGNVEGYLTKKIKGRILNYLCSENHIVKIRYRTWIKNPIEMETISNHFNEFVSYITPDLELETRDLISCLDETDQYIVNRLLENLSVSDTATMMGCSRQSIYIRITNICQVIMKIGQMNINSLSRTRRKQTVG